MGLVKAFLPRRDHIPKGLFERINFVITMWNNPCDVPWVLYMETLKPAALEAFITLIDFSIEDIARNIFRPAGLDKGKGGGHGRGRRQKLTRRVQRKFGPLKALQDRKIGGGLKFLWIVDTGFQRVLWYFLVADVATEFLYRWTSGIYCTDASDTISCPGAALAFTESQVHLGISGWDAQTWVDVKYERGGASIDGPVLNMIDGMWLIASGGTCTPTGDGTIRVQMRLRVVSTGEILDITALQDVSKLSPGDFVVGAQVQDPSNVVAETQSDPGGNYVFTGSVISAQLRPPGGPKLCP